MLSAHSHRLVATFYLLLLCAAGVLSQTIRNPAFWQEQFLRNVSNSDVLASSVNDTSRLASSQDFQTVYAGTDSIMTFRRAIVSFEKCCLSSNLTLERLQSINYNSSLLNSTITQSKIALVERGGCNWTEKSEVARSLSLAYSLNVEAVIIYDNTSYPAGDIEYTLTATVGTTFIQAYSGELVNERNISHMLDNNIVVGNRSLPLYFVPRLYGRALLNSYAKAFAKLTANETSYWMLAPVVRAKEWTSSTSTNNSTASQPGTGVDSTPTGSHEQTLEEFKSIIIAAFILLRWWMKRSLANQLAQETQRREEIYRMEQLKKPLPINVLNSFPVVKYKTGCVRDTSCSICLDDFEEDVHEIRILPCGHGFCVLCIGKYYYPKKKEDAEVMDISNDKNNLIVIGSGEDEEEESETTNSYAALPAVVSTSTLPHTMQRDITPRTSIDEVVPIVPTIPTETANNRPGSPNLSKVPKEDKSLSDTVGPGVTESSDTSSVVLDTNLLIKEEMSGFINSSNPVLLSTQHEDSSRPVMSDVEERTIQQTPIDIVGDSTSHAVQHEATKLDTEETKNTLTHKHD
ncbi:hypothetical protein PHYBLDRAFT_143650 [Phycomyces blakesleeanus NRRL 1555(-)]|uniref:RING-type domain-containing protein n=1 Tax=Phycomyces blakesleeanus (strain ATCC 8743b / DSM 1359 / FGSC 10004 / NBRC 33097 / NRRL 1555) TaxID=763407 RepID=A0A162XK43_PHYB8|nr:hypothetical protein PHYBLDRAFT_143650 [Phycomyces blakesleeanus NRRL 1555(-)]OAD75405.1 hypothetical protein PHYBLDRAFT_143650 [Phycomyces blakesleeanus NRRL 1555(-)]|eukprot:XP_018293445.1 hypothetical protein PHYBLDRAFT_143650 [Phycomyces blakesleeanus NRRL 1555(-)]